VRAAAAAGGGGGGGGMGGGVQAAAAYGCLASPASSTDSRPSSQARERERERERARERERERERLETHAPRALCPIPHTPTHTNATYVTSGASY
jgi:hypothetical protein